MWPLQSSLPTAFYVGIMRNREMKILFIENHPHFGKIVTGKFLYNHEVTLIPSIEIAIKMTREAKFDVALVDHDLDDGKGDDFVRYVKGEFPSLPCIAMSSHERGNQALLSAGAVDVCSKMKLLQLIFIVQRHFFTWPILKFRLYILMTKSLQNYA